MDRVDAAERRLLEERATGLVESRCRARRAPAAERDDRADRHRDDGGEAGRGEDGEELPVRAAARGARMTGFPMRTGLWRHRPPTIAATFAVAPGDCGSVRGWRYGPSPS